MAVSVDFEFYCGETHSQSKIVCRRGAAMAEKTLD